MRSRIVTTAVVLAAVMSVVMQAAAARSAAPGPSPLAPFFARLASSGSAEVRIERRRNNAARSEARLTGRMILEPPGRARLDLDPDGESVTLRPDGGEWLQPRLRQRVRLGPARARAALAWWGLLLGSEPGAFSERALADGRVLVTRGEPGAPADSAWVTLRGALPARLEFRGGEGDTQYELRGWRFGRARSDTMFVIPARVGFETVDLP